MSFPRFLAAGVVVSLALHGTGSAFFAKDPDDVSIAASQGGGVSVIGSIEDLVAGAQVEKVTDTPLAEEVEPLTKPAEPVRAPVEIAKAVQETPVRPVEVTPVRPVTEPVQTEIAARSSEVVPVVEGVTLAEPVTAVSPADAVLPEDLPKTEPAPVPVDMVKPAEVASLEVNETPEPVEPVKPVTELLEAVPDPLQEVTETPRTKPEPPVRKTLEKTRTARKKGSDASSQKGGERITSDTARSNANGRADARSEDGGTKAASNYKGKVVAKLRRAKRYPREARRQNLAGTVRVAFTIAANGSVSGIRITRSSGHPVLDQAAVEMVQRAAPMPKFPGDIRLAHMNLQVPVRFDR